MLPSLLYVCIRTSQLPKTDRAIPWHGDLALLGNISVDTLLLIASFLNSNEALGFLVIVESVNYCTEDGAPTISIFSEQILYYYFWGDLNPEIDRAWEQIEQGEYDREVQSYFADDGSNSS